MTFPIVKLTLDFLSALHKMTPIEFVENGAMGSHKGKPVEKHVTQAWADMCRGLSITLTCTPREIADQAWCAALIVEPTSQEHIYTLMNESKTIREFVYGQIKALDTDIDVLIYACGEFLKSDSNSPATKEIRKLLIDNPDVVQKFEKYLNHKEN